MGIMGRQKWFVALVCVGITALMWVSGAQANTALLNLPVKNPDIFASNITLTYTESTHELTATGIVQMKKAANGTVTIDHSNVFGSFYLDALVDNQGHVINHSAYVDVVFQGSSYFNSGALAAALPHSPLSNANFIGFGYSKGALEFEFAQNSNASSLFDVQLHTSQSFAATGNSLFWSDPAGFRYVSAYSDTSVVAPLPKSAVLGIVMFAILASVAVTRHFRCSGVSIAE